MIPPLYQKLADGLCGFSIALEPGETVLIDAYDIPTDMTLALIRAIRAHKAHPLVNLRDNLIHRELVRGGSAEQFQAEAKTLLEQMQGVDAYIGLRGSHNIFEHADTDPEQMARWMAASKPVTDYRVSQTKWVVLRWPHSAMAQQAGMSTEAFEDFYFRVCTQDYARMQPGMEALKQWMEKTDHVRLTGEGTNLNFSIKNIPAVTCGGQYNIPDGEVFTAPVKDSVEGVIHFNAPTVYQGTSFDDIRLVFEKGKIIEATGSNTERLNAVLDQDAGARYIGEFAIGFNPLILEPMRDILFDEKIAGSFHFTPGQAYDEADNGNRSQVHWDMVMIQRPEWGGGEIYFDDVLIRRDGLFIPDELQALNPERLLEH
jgi:aminopeptidase